MGEPSRHAGGEPVEGAHDGGENQVGEDREAVFLGRDEEETGPERATADRAEDRDAKHGGKGSGSLWSRRVEGAGDA